MIPIFPKYIFIDDTTIRRKIVDNVIRSETEVGPQKTRPIQSKPMAELSCTMSVFEDDFYNLNEWYSNEIGFGSKWFRMKCPIFGDEKRFRFVDTELDWRKVGTTYEANVTIESYA